MRPDASADECVSTARATRASRGADASSSDATVSAIGHSHQSTDADRSSESDRRRDEDRRSGEGHRSGENPRSDTSADRADHAAHRTPDRSYASSLSRLRFALAIVGVLSLLVGLVRGAAASNVAAGLAPGSEAATVPTWLYLLTGGAAIGASGLMAGLVTDRTFIDHVHSRTVGVSTGAGLLRLAAAVGSAVGLLGLAIVVLVGGFVETALPVANAAIVVTFVGVRGVLVIVAFAVGNVWPAINPWATIARHLPSGYREYPRHLGAWPAVVGLLALVWVELVLPLTNDPQVLAVVAICYSLATVAGAVVYGLDDWFHYADPLSVVFRLFGAVAPLQRTDDGVELVLPGSRLRGARVIDHPSEIAFVVLLVWELTFSGFVVTPPGGALVEAVAGLGVPPRLVYLLALVAGFAGFVGAYRLATRYSRRTGTTYVAADDLAMRFAPALLGIAAGYHLAHYAGFVLSLAPAATAVLTSPLSPPANPVVLGLPGWFPYLEASFVLVGHLVAIWAAHATAFECFPGRIQAIRSQYPFIAIMVFYTMASLWLLSLPVQSPPFVAA